MAYLSTLRWLGIIVCRLGLFLLPSLLLLGLGDLGRFSRSFGVFLLLLLSLRGELFLALGATRLRRLFVVFHRCE